MKRNIAVIIKEQCVACGVCQSVCPKGAVTITNGVYASFDKEVCVGCGRCVKACPASIIRMEAAK